MSNDIRSFYKNKNVLITGATGFLGKLLIEKLLRSCDVEGIFLIVKPKRGLTPEERLRDIMDEPIYYKIHETDPKSFRRVHVLEGNLNKKYLGLDEESRLLIKEKINIVFHCGASLNMDLKIQDAVITNVRGTMELLNLLGESESIQAFVMVSTAYSHCYLTHIEEKFYESPIQAELLVKLSEELSPDLLADISKGLLGQWTNSYVFTKAVTENLIYRRGKTIPAGVFRPAIITSTVSEPLPGWSDNLYGPLGLLLSSHCGILRVIRANGNLRNHTVPGDMCINAILCFAWDISNKWTAQKKDYSPIVLNFSAKDTKLFIPSEQYMNNQGLKYVPFKKTMWYDMIVMVENKYVYIALKFLLHSIPAYLVDSLMIMSARKGRMRSIYAKLDKTINVLSHFLLNEWDISNENVRILWEQMTQEDKECFNFDINSFDVDTYFKDMILGLKRYVLKEDVKKMKLHMHRYQRLMLLHYTFKYFLIFLATLPVVKGISKLVRNARKFNKA